MLHVPCENGYDQGTCLCYSLNVKLEIALRYGNISFGMVFIGKYGSGKVFSHLFTLFYTQNFTKIRN